MSNRSAALIAGVAAMSALAAVPARAATPQAWLTSADHAQVLAPAALQPGGGAAQVTVTLDPGRRLQPIDGFGFALTGGSAELLQRMSPAARHALLVELFDPRGPGARVSWLRVSIGASDMDRRVFSYDDLPAGAADPSLARFSLAPDERALVPTLREILAIAPGLPILASPWSPPTWMKTNGAPKGGSLRPDMGDAFAGYLVRYVRGMAAEGVPIRAVTLQNEPENAGNTPSMLMTAPEQAALIAHHVGPAFRAAGLRTRIVAFDHNCDHPAYPLAVEEDPRAAAYVAGAGFHLYEGGADAMSRVHAAHPDKPVWLTEQMVIDGPAMGRPTPVAQPLARVVLASLNNWAQGVLLWNLAADPAFGPHTGDGGCTVCEGAVTLDGDRVTRNVAYAAVAQVSRFVPRGSVRIGSNSSDAAVAATAFRTPDGATVLVLADTAASDRRVAAAGPQGPVTVVVPAGGAVTVRWPVGG